LSDGAQERADGVAEKTALLRGGYGVEKEALLRLFVTMSFRLWIEGLSAMVWLIFREGCQSGYTRLVKMACWVSFLTPEFESLVPNAHSNCRSLSIFTRFPSP